MTMPRQVFKDSIILVTRRCALRKFFLRPEKEINEIILYCLGYASKRYNIYIHAFIFMSNHYHIILTDPDGNMPSFMSWFNAYVAKNLNVIHNKKESIWSPGSYSCAIFGYPGFYLSEEDIIDKLVYVYTNPVSAGLVKTFKDWPGVISMPGQVEGKPIKVKRPGIFFDPKGNMPGEITFSLKKPGCFKDTSNKDFIRILNERIRQREREIQKEFLLKGKTFLGKEKILAQSPFATPKTAEKKKEINPRLICKDKWNRIVILSF